MLKYPWDDSWQTMTTHGSFPTELTVKKLTFDVHGNQNNPWNMKQCQSYALRINIINNRITERPSQTLYKIY